MRATATANRLRVSPQKARLVIDQIRGMPVTTALDVLRFDVQKSSRHVSRLLESAVANAENKNAAVDDLWISEAYVNEGLTLKRLRFHGRGRTGRVFKRTCHITLAVSDENQGAR
ncbi:MAG: 50S ribosomal protein L22 [Gammaproteobacteria bacterium]|nr:50S ribosomal protein L22 [Gammaproteobacteria bacterium]